MKKLIVRLIICGSLYLCILCVFFALSASENGRGVIADITNSSEYAYENFGSSEIVPYVERVRSNDSYTKLVIGDSMCHQLFDKYYEANDTYCISGTNQAVTLAGQYLLAREFVENHAEVTDIYLIIIMDSLASDYNTQLGYQYAVMPFAKTDTLTYLDEDTKKDIASIYGAFFCKKPVVEFIDRSPLSMKLYLNLLAKKETFFPRESTHVISDTSYRYLEKIRLLCEERGITFHLIPGPHADNAERHKMEEYMRIELETDGDKLGLKTYLDELVYYPEWMFRDRAHFDKEKLPEEFFQGLATEILPDILTF